MRIARERRFWTGVLISATPVMAFFGFLALGSMDPEYQVQAGTAEADITTLNDREVLSATIKDFTSVDFAAASGVVVAVGATIAISSLTDKSAEEDAPELSGLAA